MFIQAEENPWPNGVPTDGSDVLLEAEGLEFSEIPSEEDVLTLMYDGHE